jgi:hypothetical protein
LPLQLPQLPFLAFHPPPLLLELLLLTSMCHA